MLMSNQRVKLEPAEKLGFPHSFAENRGQKVNRLGARMENYRANRNPRLTGRSWVYFAQRGDDGPIKIGRTRQLADRMAALRSTQPEEMNLIGKLPEVVISEARSHILFRHLRMRGEWFQPAPEILELAAASLSIYGPGYIDDIPECLSAQWAIIQRFASSHCGHIPGHTISAPSVREAGR